VLARLPPHFCDVFQAHYLAVQNNIANCVTIKISRSDNAHWQIWLTFCQETGPDPFLKSFEGPVPYPQIFSHQYQHGIIVLSGNRVTADYASTILCLVGQTFKRMEALVP